MKSVQADTVIGSSVRQSAMLIHALPASDRAWVLSKLSPTQTASLRPLIEELESIGMPKNLELFEQTVILDTASSTESNRLKLDPGSVLQNSSASKYLSQLDSAACESLFLILRDEPPMLVARLLNLGPWIWEANFLHQLMILKRKQIADCRSQLLNKRQPEALAASIVELAAERLVAATHHQPKSSATHHQALGTSFSTMNFFKYVSKSKALKTEGAVS
jgi:hypothetical protein